MTSFAEAVAGNKILASRWNAMRRGMILGCLSTDRPSDPGEGSWAYETDTKLYIRYIDGRWTYANWDGRSAFGDPRVGTKPADPYTFPCLSFEYTYSLTLLSTDGAFTVPYPTTFPNCVLTTRAEVDSGASNLIQIITDDAQPGTLDGYAGHAMSWDPATGLVAPTPIGSPIRVLQKVFGL